MKDQKERFQKDAEAKSADTKGARAKGNRAQRRKMSKDRSEKDKFYSKTKGSNDLTWHTPDAELLRRTANIPWSYQTGEMVQNNRSICGLADEDPTYVSQPGFMAIRTLMSVGSFGDTWAYQNAPTYTAANSLLTTMRARTRVRNTYDAPDVLMLMLAMDNIYGTVAWFKRLAATVRMYTYQNHYMPRDLLKAQGVDPDWFEKNQYTFVTQLNVIISEINKVYIPSRMHLFELHNQRFSNYYTEGESIKDQIYFFTPAFISEIDYNATADYQSMIKPIGCFPGTYTRTDGVFTGCTYNAQGWQTMTGDVLLDMLRQMLRKVIEHDSTADITGDMENAFGTTERFILSNCDPDAIAAPIFDEEILETIHNTAVLYGPRAIYQSYNSESTVPYFCTVQDVNTNRIGTYDEFRVQRNDAVKQIIFNESCFNIIDVHRDPSPEKTFAITRLRPVVRGRYDGLDAYVEQLEFGADLVCNVEVYYYSIVNGVNTLQKLGMDTVTVVSSNAKLLGTLAPFHYRPLLMPVQPSTYKFQDSTWYYGETDIYSFLPDLDTVRNMNRLSLLTLLGAYNNL